VQHSGKSYRGRFSRGSGLPRVPNLVHSGKSYRGRFSRGSGLPRVPNLVNSGKPSLSATLTLGDDLIPSVPSNFFSFLQKNLFPECYTRGRFFLKKNPLPRVQHSGKKFLFLKKKPLPRVLGPGTRGRQLLVLNFKKSSLSATAQALGKAFFFAFPCDKQNIYAYKPQININISQTTFKNHKRPNLSEIHNIYYKPQVQKCHKRKVIC
jgi:hypothetical protein